MIDGRFEAALVQPPERLDGDSDEAWSLDSSIAVVLPAPTSIHFPERPDPLDRWEALLSAFERELIQTVSTTPGFEAVTPVREPYRKLPPTDQGGGLGDLTELLTLLQNADSVVQSLSGWLALADLAVKAPDIWKRVRFRMHEHDAPGEWPKLPILSLPFIQALCIKDMVERYGIDDVPTIAVSTRPSGTGGQQHPTGDEHHILSTTMGSTIVQRLVWIAGSQGICWEKFLLLDGPPLEVHALPVPEWVSPHPVLAV